MQPRRLIILSTLLVLLQALTPAEDIQLFPNTQNSPSLYLIKFKLDKALPSLSYLFVAMEWYSSALLPYNCALVNTSISVRCTNFNSQTFTVTASVNNFKKFNDILDRSKVVAVELGSNLLANTTYALQLHLYNVVPNIQKISPSVEMYTISADGLIYQQNPNMGAVINSKPNTQLMSVSILNDLSANSPGSSSTLRAEVTIGQAVSTPLSTFMFTVHYPFAFSVGSIPTTTESTSYATNPIALYSSPNIYSYEVLTPNIFMLVFNQKFTVGRKFIVQINQITNPFQIASTNISIYSLNYNTLTPLQAYEMLYPIATASYPLSLTLGLPYDAPFQDCMQYYKSSQNYIQLSILIPYSIPAGYVMRIQFTNTNAEFYAGTAYINIDSLTYTPIYDYSISQYILLISNIGPIVVGTTLKVTALIYVNSNTQFSVSVYIDTPSIITTSPSKYLYQGLVEGSGISYSNFLSNFYDNQFSWSWRVRSSTSFISGQWIYFYVYQDIDSLATSSGSYVRFYLPPIVEVSPSFDPNNDCRISNNVNSCQITFVKTSSYLQITIKGSTSYLVSNPNIFPYRTSIYIYLRNLLFPKSSSNKIVYPIYATLYKSDVVNPTEYMRMYFISANPSESGMTGVTFDYLSNYITSTSANYQTYPGALRFASTIPASMNLVVQPQQRVVVTFFARYGFRSLTTKHMNSYPCTSNIGVSCQYFQGQSGWAQLLVFDQIVATFTDTSYATASFHLIIPDMQTSQQNNYFWYHVGIYNTLSKDYSYTYAARFYRDSSNWPTSVSTYSTFQANIVGKAGSYKDNVAITVYNPSISTGGTSFVFLCTQWSLFENGVTTYSPTTLSMTTPATFSGTNEKSPLALYLANSMYLTILPFTYVSSQTTFTFYLRNAHMPYSYDLPNYYIYAVRNSDWFMTSSNAMIMANGGTLYESPLQSLVVSCQDNAVGVVNTYCTVVFGTTNPLLANGKIRLSLSGLTVATSTCFLYFSNGSAISVTCESSSDNKNVTVTMSGWQFYPIGTYTLVVHGIGISSDTLSQSMTLYLYESSLSFVIETGVRILMTTIAGLNYISLTEIMYAHLNPLSYTTMTINYYLPRQLYKDQQFAFVIGQDLSDVNTEVSRLAIHITRQDGVVLYPRYYIDNINYLIVFSFDDPTQLTASTYIMTIAGICTPVTQKNVFNMIYRRKQDFAYTLVNNYENVIFPELEALVTSDISLQSYFNTEGYKQDIVFTIINQNDKVNSLMLWVINFPSYYSSQLFQQLPYCMINGSPIPCSVDPTTPQQLLIYNSPATIQAGTPYEITVVGLAAPRRSYTNNAYPLRYIFVGVLISSTSSVYVERAMLTAEQNIQSTVTGVIKVLDMIGVSASSLYSFSSLYAQFQMQCNVAITTGSYLYLDLPIEFNNLNNVPINSIILFGSNTISTNTQVVDRRIQIPISTTIPANTIFQVQFPNLPTPLAPCSTEMSTMIVTVTPSSKLTLTAASQIQGNSAPRLTFQPNNLYISFNYDQPIVITAGTYSQAIPITPSDNSTFLSNTNIQLQSTGFIFQPSTVFLPIGQKGGSFQIGADNSLVPITYFYQAVKQEEVNTRYQITLNMNIKITNIPVAITIPSAITVPQGGCSSPYTIQLTNSPFTDLTITYVYDNTLYSETDLYPNPITTPPEMNFNVNNTNGTLSFCVSSSLPLGSIPLALYLSGTNYNSYTFSPSNQITLNVVNTVANTTPVLTLNLNNQQKTFLDVNFTNNVDGIIFYQMAIGSGVTTNSLQNMQVYTKSGQWILASRADFFSRLYTTDRDKRITQFFQAASTTTIRISNLFPETPYTLCAYLVNAFGVVSSPACLNLYTMAWGTAIKARLYFSSVLSPQQLNNVLCFFTVSSGTNQLYLVDGEGNSCGNRTVSNVYYKFKGSSFTTELHGTNIYLFTNPSLTGSDPAPLAFTNLFAGSGSLSASTIASAQSMFSITYLSGSYTNSFNARMMTDPSQASGLSVFYSTPMYNSGMKQIIIDNVQIIGGAGTIYFLLVFYKQIVVNSTSGHTTVNIRMNQQPTNEQILNCQNWLGQTAQGCARAVYTGVSPLKVIFTNVEPNSMYQLYYVVASEFPMRPIVESTITSDTVVTYAWAEWLSLSLLGFLLMIL